MASNEMPAARIDDKVNHTSALAGAIAGALVGAALGVALVYAAPALAVVAVAGVALPAAAGAALFVASIAVIGSELGEWIGKMTSSSPAGDVANGSDDTFLENRKAARVRDEVKCHRGERIATGCKTIFVNSRNAARVKEETTCDGRVATGCETVFYGGPSASSAPKRKSGELPAVFFWVREVVDIVTTVFGWFAKAPINAFEFAAKNLRRAEQALDLLDKAYFIVDKGLSYSGQGDAVTEHPAWKLAGPLLGVANTVIGLKKARLREPLVDANTHTVLGSDRVIPGEGFWGQTPSGIYKPTEHFDPKLGTRVSAAPPPPPPRLGAPPGVTPTLFDPYGVPIGGTPGQIVIVPGG